jgi:hypothetical protein
MLQRANIKTSLEELVLFFRPVAKTYLIHYYSCLSGVKGIMQEEENKIFLNNMNGPSKSFAD